MKIGFTGTRDGMTLEQNQAVRQLLLELLPTEAHHGACLGADHNFMQLLQYEQDMNRPCEWFVYPSDLPRWTCEHCLCHADHVAEPTRPLDRNRDIVDATEILIACPNSDQEQQRSGTWSTVRYARLKGKTIYLVLPSGEVRKE